MTQIALPRRVDRSGLRIHGRTEPAAMNRYRSRPESITHAPALPYCQTRIERIRISSASTSMSKRAPNAVDVFVRRASHPSTPSNAVTIEARTIAIQIDAAGAGRTTNSATTATSSARTLVTRFAGDIGGDVSPPPHTPQTEEGPPQPARGLRYPTRVRGESPRPPPPPPRR